MVEYDYIVVGGGTAGAIVAYRLAQRFPERTVCLLEAGPPDEGDDRVMKLIRWPELLGSELDFSYVIEPQERGNESIVHNRARVLGGCSSHNSCIAFIAPDCDFEDWVKQTSFSCWSAQQVLPFYHRVLEKVHLEFGAEQNAANQAFIQAAKEAGYPEVKWNNPRINKDFPESVGMFHLNKLGPIRQSSSVAYLHPLSRAPKNLIIKCKTTAIKIIFQQVGDKQQAVGVQTNSGETLKCKREVVVSCGAFDTPKLLMLSGIGPSWHLREIDIPLVKALPGVGSNLLDHPEGVMNWETNRKVPTDTTQGWETGIFVDTQKFLGKKAPSEKTVIDLMCHFGVVVFDMHTKPKGYPTATDGISITPNVCKPKSHGVVRLRSSHPEDPPKIDFKYFTDPEGNDEEIMLTGVKLARHLASQPALKKWIKRELSPGEHIQSDKDLSDYIRKTANTVYHPCSTCKMGSDNDPTAVVDHELKVRGTVNLRIADASVFPSHITVNPCLTIMMIGERCADFIIKADKDVSAKL